MPKSLTPFVVAYMFVLFFSFLSELTYRKRSLADIKADKWKIFWRATISFVVLIVASFIYHILGIGAK
jgi:hypothetical protein